MGFNSGFKGLNTFLFIYFFNCSGDVVSVELKIRMFAYHPSRFPHPSSPPSFAVSRPVCAISFFRVISIPGFHLPNLDPQ